MGVMSLYRYVADRAHLERQIVDLVLRPVDLAVPVRAPWCERVTVLAERMRAAVGDHPNVVPLLVTHRHASGTLRRWAEALLVVLTEAGFGGERRVIALRCLLSFVIGALQYQQLGPLAGPGTAVLAALPDGECPLLAETARQAGAIPPDDEFRRGLALVLRGLASDR